MHIHWGDIKGENKSQMEEVCNFGMLDRTLLYL